MYTVQVIIFYFFNKENYKCHTMYKNIGCISEIICTSWFSCETKAFENCALLGSLTYNIYFLFSFFFSCFLGLYLWHMEVPRLGAELELQLPAGPQPQQHGIWAAPATYTTALSTTGSLTHWPKQGIESSSSQILVGLISTEPQWKLPIFFFFSFQTVLLTLKHRDKNHKMQMESYGVYFRGNTDTEFPKDV